MRCWFVTRYFEVAWGKSIKLAKSDYHQYNNVRKMTHGDSEYFEITIILIDFKKPSNRNLLILVVGVVKFSKLHKITWTKNDI